MGWYRWSVWTGGAHTLAGHARMANGMSRYWGGQTGTGWWVWIAIVLLDLSKKHNNEENVPDGKFYKIFGWKKCFVKSWKISFSERFRHSEDCPPVSLLIFKIISSMINNEGNTSKFVVITVPADGIAPLGARPSAGTLMTRLVSRLWDVLEPDRSIWYPKYLGFVQNCHISRDPFY